MTNTTPPEVLALAREITLELWPGDETEYLFERRAAQEAAITAIMEVTERAAVYVKPRSILSTYDLRNMEHLK